MGLQIQIHIESTYHSGVLFRPSIISYNSQCIHIPLLSVQQTCHCDTALQHQTQQRI